MKGVLERATAADQEVGLKMNEDKRYRYKQTFEALGAHIEAH